MTEHPTYTVGGKPTDWALIPEHMIGGMRRYVENGIAPGGFLSAVLCNDLKNAIGRADTVNRHRLQDIVQFVVWNLPSECQGSYEKYKAWIERGGMKADTVYQG